MSETRHTFHMHNAKKISTQM